MNFTSVSGTSFDIQGVPLGNLYLQSDVDGGVCYLNHTTTKYTGYYVSFKAVHTSNDFYFYWYNATGSVIIEIKMGTPEERRIYYKDCNSNYVTLYDSSANTNYIVSWQYYTSNVIQYKVYNSAYTLLAIVNGTGLLSGERTKEEFNLSSMKIYSTDIYLTNYNYFYEYGYISEDLEEEEGCPSIDGWIVKTNDVLGIKSVKIGDIVEYEITTVGDVNGYYWFTIRDNNNHLKYYNADVTINSNPHTYNFFVYYDYSFTSGIYNFSLESGIYYGCSNTQITSYNTFYVSGGVEENYTSIYGNETSWVEWDYLNSQYQFKGNSIDFVYFFPENISATTSTEDFYYIIALQSVSSNGIIYNYFYPSQSVFNTTVIDHKSLGNWLYTGSYRLLIYNMSSVSTRNFNESYLLGTLENYSSVIKVYEGDDDNDGIPNELDPDYTDPDDVVIDSGSYIYYIGLGFALCIGVIGAAVGGGIGFMGGFIGSLVVFSVPGTPFQFFPTVTLFIFGLVAILMVIFMIRR